MLLIKGTMSAISAYAATVELIAGDFAWTKMGKKIEHLGIIWGRI